MSDQEKQEPASDQSAKASSGQRPDNRGGRDRKARRRQNTANRPLDESVNMDELREIVELIAEHGFTDFELENKDVRVRLRRELTPQIVSMPVTESRATELSTSHDASASTNAEASGAAKSGVASGSPGEAHADTAAGDDEGLQIITSPIVGTFFRSPSPSADPFVRIGSQVSIGTVVCIIEAMKLMNEIQADWPGVIEKIYVENGQPVEYGQPLFGIKQ